MFVAGAVGQELLKFPLFLKSRKRTLSFCEAAGSYRGVLVTRKVIEKIFLEVMYKYKKIGSILISLSKGKFDLTYLMTCEAGTGSGD